MEDGRGRALAVRRVDIGHAIPPSWQRVSSRRANRLARCARPVRQSSAVVWQTMAAILILILFKASASNFLLMSSLFVIFCFRFANLSFK